MRARVFLEQKTFKAICLICGTLLLILFSVMLIFYFNVSKNKCMTSPFTWGAEKVSQGNLSVMCSCYFNDIRYAPFYFDKNKVTIGLP